MTGSNTNRALLKFMQYMLGLAFFICISLPASFSQNTLYDQLPNLDPMHKPAWSDDFPLWAKMLYQDHVNFYEIEQLFQRDTSKYKEKCPILRYYKQWSLALMGYVHDDGEIILPPISMIHNNLKFAREKSFSQLRNQDSVWRFVGPKETFWLNNDGDPEEPAACSWQVNVYAFDVAKSNPNILYAGTETGFVNKSTNRGMDWQQMGRSYNFGGAVTAVAIHPFNPDTVYIGAGGYVHTSTDGGKTWKSVPVIINGSITKILIHPSQTGKLICAGSKGIFISEDSGDNWSQVTSSKVWDIEFRPDDPSIIYAITLSFESYQLLVSVNAGASFEQVDGFPTNITESSGGLLAVCDSDPDLLYYALLAENNRPILGKGYVGGENWEFITINLGMTSAFPMDNGQGFFDFVLEVNPTNPNELFAGTTTLFKSTNGGASFSAIGGYTGPFPIHPDVQCMKYVSSDEVWVSTDGGMGYSADAFTLVSNFSSRNNGLIGSAMWGFDQGWNEDIIVGGRYHNGNTAIADFYGEKALRMGGAESPTGWVLQGESRHVAFNDLGNGWVLPQTAEGQPEGRFLFTKYPNMDEYGGRRSNLIHHPNYYGTLYLAQGSGFWQSSDMGSTFDLLYSFPDRVRYVQGSISNPKIFYADVVKHGIFKSEDGGMTWNPKPALIQETASTYWQGRTFFVISPYDENTIYACLQNGTWSSDIGGIYKSTDGGDSWENWTGDLNVYTKNMVIQPAEGNKDLIYLFATNGNGRSAEVFYRYSDGSEWIKLGDDFVSGMSVNIGLPFFRDSKLRVSGSAGVWETDLLDTNYDPIINPWTYAPRSNCMLDTIQFEDHSIIDHAGVSWEWAFEPEPLFVDYPNKRNPKVVLGSKGSYDVHLSLIKNGKKYSRSIEDMVTTIPCPSIDDCSNPVSIPKSKWSIIGFDSEEINYPGYANMTIDGNFSSIWHTRWSTGSDPYPHEITLDLDTLYQLHTFIYYPRTDGVNGRIKDFEIYLDDQSTPIATGSWENSAAPKYVHFENDVAAQKVRLKALSEVNGNAWASCAEIEIIGCHVPLQVSTKGGNSMTNIHVYPMPVKDVLTIDLGISGELEMSIYSEMGSLINQSNVQSLDGLLKIPMSQYGNGLFYIRLIDQNGLVYAVKTIIGQY